MRNAQRSRDVMQLPRPDSLLPQRHSEARLERAGAWKECSARNSCVLGERLRVSDGGISSYYYGVEEPWSALASTVIII